MCYFLNSSTGIKGAYVGETKEYISTSIIIKP